MLHLPLPYDKVPERLLLHRPREDSPPIFGRDAWLRILSCWFSFQPLHTWLQTSPVHIGGTDSIKPTRSYNPQVAERQSCGHQPWHFPAAVYVNNERNQWQRLALPETSILEPVQLIAGNVDQTPSPSVEIRAGPVFYNQNINRIVPSESGVPQTNPLYLKHTLRSLLLPRKSPPQPDQNIPPSSTEDNNHHRTGGDPQSRLAAPLQHLKQCRWQTALPCWIPGQVTPLWDPLKVLLHGLPRQSYCLCRHLQKWAVYRVPQTNTAFTNVFDKFTEDQR